MRAAATKGENERSEPTLVGWSGIRGDLIKHVDCGGGGGDLLGCLSRVSHSLIQLHKLPLGLLQSGLPRTLVPLLLRALYLLQAL